MSSTVACSLSAELSINCAICLWLAVPRRSLWNCALSDVTFQSQLSTVQTSTNECDSASQLPSQLTHASRAPSWQHDEDVDALLLANPINACKHYSIMAFLNVTTVYKDKVLHYQLVLDTDKLKGKLRKKYVRFALFCGKHKQCIRAYFETQPKHLQFYSCTLFSKI